MSEPIPEAIPTSHDPRSKRPTKRRALTPTSAQAAQLDALFANPERDIRLPTGPGAPKTLAAPPEIVANVQGSSAGAGSGEFHVYKASRRREYERLRLMDEEVRKEKEKLDFERDRDEKKARDAEKTRRNKAKRDKAKQRKAKAKDEKGGGGDGKETGKSRPADDESEMDVEQRGPTGSKQRDGKDRPLNGINDAKAELNGATEDATTSNPEEIGVVIHDDD